MLDERLDSRKPTPSSIQAAQADVTQLRASALRRV